MVKACGSFRPAFECDSLLQVKELVKRGVCAGVLGSIGTHGLKNRGVQVRGFAPQAGYGRPLVLHWNERQMRRRGLETGGINEVALALEASAVNRSG